jgi:hypothetical protein
MKQVMHDDNGPAVYRQVQDEIFLSKQCERDAEGKSLYPNPHDARIENERYCFHFPATWYYSHAVNKAIGLRTITLIPRWYTFDLQFRIINPMGDTIRPILTHTITPHMDMGEIASKMEFLIDQAIRRLTISPAGDTHDLWVRPLCKFNNDARTFTIQFTSYNQAARPIEDYTIVIDVGTEDDFFNTLNVPENDRGNYALYSSPVMTFYEVWNRDPNQLYFHASFVNHTQFNYLGRTGDFYPKPSKIFTADNLPMDFYFWITTDIMKPILLHGERFIIELAFIIDSKDYQSP